VLARYGSAGQGAAPKHRLNFIQVLLDTDSNLIQQGPPMISLMKSLVDAEIMYFGATDKETFGSTSLATALIGLFNARLSATKNLLVGTQWYALSFTTTLVGSFYVLSSATKIFLVGKSWWIPKQCVSAPPVYKSKLDYKLRNLRKGGRYGGY
jgi:hypothetical protein